MTFKVANFISSFNSKSGGPPGTVSLIAKAGIGHWRADLFTTGYRESATDSLLLETFPGEVKILPVRSNPTWGGLGMMAGINSSYGTQLLRAAAPDVIHFHGLWSLWLAAFAEAAIRLRIPYVVTPHGMLEPWSLAVRSWRKAIALKSYQGRILMRAAAIHATSNMEAENLRRLGLTSVPILVVPNIVEEPTPIDAADGVSAEARRVLLFLSRIHEKKVLIFCYTPGTK